MPWSTDKSTGFLTHFTGTIAESYFGTDPRYNNGESLLLIWEIDDISVLQEDFDGELPEPFTISMPVGKDWFSDDGSKAEHKRKKETFHATSIYGRLIDAVTGETDGFGPQASTTDDTDLEVDLTGLRDVLPERGDPTEAEIWKGLSFEFKEVLFDFGERKGEKMQSRRTLPVKVAGESPAKPKRGGGKKTSAAKPKEEAPKESAAEKARRIAAEAKERAKAKESTNGDNPLLEVVDGDAELADQLLAMLTEADDYNAFVDACVTLPVMMENDVLLAKVLDENEGPWALKDSVTA